jgi:hypothetical protein
MDTRERLPRRLPPTGEARRPSLFSCNDCALSGDAGGFGNRSKKRQRDVRIAHPAVDRSTTPKARESTRRDSIHESLVFPASCESRSGGGTSRETTI